VFISGLGDRHRSRGFVFCTFSLQTPFVHPFFSFCHVAGMKDRLVSGGYGLWSLFPFSNKLVLGFAGSSCPVVFSPPDSSLLEAPRNVSPLPFSVPMIRDGSFSVPFFPVPTFPLSPPVGPQRETPVFRVLRSTLFPR